ncbi:MAG: alpha/beta hydrolase domain-containing protein [Gammaproteobacteria bacterium]|nr:alpha/beta hydrolase domain-containing protein [Gammaproteobacteria bacterium]
MAVQLELLQSSKPYADRRSFGEFGEYAIAEFEIRYAVDPQHVANSRITDLDKAPLMSDESVHFKGNARLVFPKNSTPSCLLVDVPNRGRPTAFSFNRPAPTELQTTSSPAGDGFLFRHGFAVLTVGWQFDAEGMSLEVPEALESNEPIAGEAICQMQPNRDTTSLLVGQGGVFTYQPSGKGRLFQRANTQAPYVEVDDDSWRFGRAHDGRFDPTTKYISKDGGFSKGVVYTLVYETLGAPIVGLGLLALRDAAAFFKYDFDWPEDRPPFTIGYGASQTGRVLRHFLYEGLNDDEAQRQVFDAVIPHIAGGQRGDFNHRFAQPGSMGIPATGQQFPFAATSTTDHLSGRREGLLDRCANPPKVLSTNTSWEYWRGDAALIHVSTDGERDVPPTESERIYMFAGTHHINGILPLTDRFALTGEQLPYPLNTISYTPLLRAVLINALAWLQDGIEPPDSRYPQLSDHSLVGRDEVVDQFSQSPRFQCLPNADNLPGLWHTDLGDEIENGVCRHPARLLSRYPRLVSNVDESLNEVAGIRLPEIAVPIGVHSGWNPRHPTHGASDQTAAFAGFSVFDGVACIPESRDSCYDHVVRLTDELVDLRYVLAEDRELVIDNAMKRYDAAQSTLTATHQE